MKSQITGVDMKKLLLALVSIGTLSNPSLGQQKIHCDSIATAEVKKIEEHQIGAVSGGVATYRQASYYVIEVIKGKELKKEINVAHLILKGNELEELKIGDKVLLCLNKPRNVIKKKGRTIIGNFGGADFEGNLLLVDRNGRLNSSLRSDSSNAVNPSLNLEIELKNGVISGFIRNCNANTVRVEIPETYGWWENTSVFYLYNSQWREAPLRELALPRARIGAYSGPLYIELKSGELLRPQGYLFPSRLLSTFEIDLSQHELPSDYWNISDIRVVTRDLWSNIIKVSLKPKK
jgi:hypothetical protein